MTTETTRTTCSSGAIKLTCKRCGYPTHTRVLIGGVPLTLRDRVRIECEGCGHQLWMTIPRRLR